MTALYESSRMSSLRRFHPVPEGSHNDTYHRGGQAYFRAMANFIEDALKVQQDMRPIPVVQAGGSSFQ
jgi:fermentation-respiration switch protein FrsA (DUF1100 family)